MWLVLCPNKIRTEWTYILLIGASFTYLLFDPGVLLYRFGGDSRGRLRGVVLLNVSAGSGDGSPSLATTDADGYTSKY